MKEGILMTDWLELTDSVVIVTGGSSGIGAAIVEELLAHGAIVADFDLQPSPRADSEMFHYYQTDVSKKDQIDQHVAAVWTKFGHIDGLVNDAGIALPGMLVNPTGTGEHELTEAMFDRTMAVNLKSVFLMSQAVGRKMVGQGSGVIVNMSTESAHEGSIGQGFYVGSKGAINSMTVTWAKELGPHGVRVLGVAPGVMAATKLRSPAYEETLAYVRGISVAELRKGYRASSNVPLRRAGALSEVASVVSFYLSKRASYVTGVITNIAGGKSRG